MTLVWRPGYTWWDPSLITTALWLDAADASTITESGGAVSEWRDKSGNGRNASQATSANQPTLSINAFNGKPTIQFDGVNDQLNLVQFAQASNQDVFAVLDTANLQTGARVFLNRLGGDAPAAYLGNNTNYRPEVYWTNPRAVWGSDVRGKAIMRWAFSTTGPTAVTQVNGNTAVTQSGFAAISTTSWATICFSATQQADVDISEIILTTSIVDIVSRQKIEGYLAHKWGLTANLPSDHPYKTNAPAP